MPSNPLFNTNKLKLGIFGTNGKGGAQTLAPEQYKPTWKASVETATMADKAGFEAIVAYARWKAYIPGRPNHPSGVVLDPFTWAAGIAQVTNYSAVFATSHAPTIHPITCAKQSATIDIISGGRFGLNVVGGWNRHELEMFGAPLKEHDARYDHLDEWLQVIQKMWSEEEEFDFAGEFYNVLRGASMPKPLQRPRPPIMNAGGSPRGMRFACQHADMAFVILRSNDPEACRKQIGEYKKVAKEEFRTRHPGLDLLSGRSARHAQGSRSVSSSLRGRTGGYGKRRRLVEGPRCRNEVIASPEQMREFPNPLRGGRRRQHPPWHRRRHRGPAADVQ